MSHCTVHCRKPPEEKSQLRNREEPDRRERDAGGQSTNCEGMEIGRNEARHEEIALFHCSSDLVKETLERGHCTIETYQYPPCGKSNYQT